ncbi:hypothetical protein B0T13DRAFT_50139 [Neurospora crassa]|nr:hypothetical protein B0T13DRAFT_50139 [Neurospora crassa]
MDRELRRDLFDRTSFHQVLDDWDSLVTTPSEPNLRARLNTGVDDGHVQKLQDPELSLGPPTMKNMEVNASQNAPDRYTCKICGFVTSSIRGYERHLGAHEHQRKTAEKKIAEEAAE